MTIQGAIAELQNLLEVDDVPFYYKGGIEKVIETIQMELADRKTEPQLKGSKRLLKGKTEPQTEENEIERLERIDNEIEDAWARIRELTDEPQTDIHDLTDCDFCTDRNCKDCEGGKDEPQSELCRGCKDYAGNGMFCAKNYMVYDFSGSVCKTEPQERSE